MTALSLSLLLEGKTMEWYLLLGKLKYSSFQFCENSFSRFDLKEFMLVFSNYHLLNGRPVTLLFYIFVLESLLFISLLFTPSKV